MIRVLAVVAWLLVGFGAAVGTVGEADAAQSCHGAASLTSIGFHCIGDGSPGSKDDSPYVESTEFVCRGHSGGVCNSVPCPGMTLAGGMQTIEHLSDGTSQPGCENFSAQAASLGPTPAQVRNAMRRLSWPASPLRIQPVKGRTLVNFRTNFYTTNTGPTTRTVALLGRRITIEATPSYRWRWGDGGRASGTSAGAAYPHLLVTHEYLRKGVVHPRLDTVYSGRFRIGNGPWRTIPGTLTVIGAPQRLEVVTARPVLVNPYG